jgi:hypothetical protein
VCEKAGSKKPHYIRNRYLNACSGAKDRAMKSPGLNLFVSIAISIVNAALRATIVIASEAKQSIAPRNEAWIASLLSLPAMTLAC